MDASIKKLPFAHHPTCVVSLSVDLHLPRLNSRLLPQILQVSETSSTLIAGLLTDLPDIYTSSSVMIVPTLAVLALVGAASAQRPTNTSICDYYTTALLKNNTADNQYTLLTLLVNTVVIGNYTKPNVGIAVPGILAKGTFNGTAVNLLPYFDGGLASSNRGHAVAENFLDDGGAVPLMMNKPSNGTSSNQ